jgi:predicted ATPase
VMLGSALTALEGHAAREADRAYARARELCDLVDDAPRLFPVLLGLGWFYLLGGLVDAARDIGRRLQRIAEATGDPGIALAAHNVLGVAALYAGEFAAALEHFERGIALYDPAVHGPRRSSAFRNVFDAGVSCTAHAAWTLWLLGHPVRAAARMDEALALARTIEHPFTLAHAWRFAAGFHVCRREPDAVRACAGASVAIAAEHGFGALLKAATFLQDWALVAAGSAEEGLARMPRSLAACRDIRAGSLLPTYLAWMAELYGRHGRSDEAVALVREGLAEGRRSGCRYWEAELHRLQATLGDPSAAEPSLLEAVAIARRQQARAFELRAATGLGRLWASRGRKTEARALVAEVCGWFTDGHDTPDLGEARALLGDLGAPRPR